MSRRHGIRGLLLLLLGLALSARSGRADEDRAAKLAKIAALRQQATGLEGLGKRLDALKLRREADKIESTLKVDVRLDSPGMSEPARQQLEKDLKTNLQKNLEASMGAGGGQPITAKDRREQLEQQEAQANQADLAEAGRKAKAWLTPQGRAEFLGNYFFFKANPNPPAHPLPVDTYAQFQASAAKFSNLVPKWHEDKGPGTFQAWLHDTFESGQTIHSQADLDRVLQQLDQWGYKIADDCWLLLDLAYRSAGSKDPKVRKLGPRNIDAAHFTVRSLDKLMAQVAKTSFDLENARGQVK